MRKVGNVLKKVHNLMHLKAVACKGKPSAGFPSGLELRLRGSQIDYRRIYGLFQDVPRFFCRPPEATWNFLTSYRS
jgi:hypothetical protein